MLSIALEGYFWYFVRRTACILYEPCLVNIFFLFMMSRWPQSIGVKAIIFRIYLMFYFNLFWLSLYQVDISYFAWTSSFYELIQLSSIFRCISNIFGYAQICTNDCFVPNFSSPKKVIFCFLALSSKDNRWGGARHGVSRLMVSS